MERVLSILNWSFAALATVFGVATLGVQLSDCPYRPIPGLHERFQPTLFAVTSVDAAMAYLPAYYKSPHPGTRAQVEAVNLFVQDRFFHGASLYRPCDNWVARLSGKVWDNLATPVLPDDILKYRRALCSQQAIVAQAMLKRLGIDYASVTFTDPGHFTPAARIGGIWYFFDPDTERQGLTPLAEVGRGNKLELMYPGALGRDLHKAAKAGRMHVRDVNAFPGPRGAAFDVLTDFLSHFGWALFLCLWLAVGLVRAELRLRRRDVRLYAVPPPPPLAENHVREPEPAPVTQSRAA